MNPDLPVPRRDLERLDLAKEPANSLPPSLVDAIEAEGGLWYAGDYYTDAASVVARAREVGAVALRLDFRDLSLLEELPKVRYLHVRSDGRPNLEPVTRLSGLRALILSVPALRGELDLRTFPQLRWLSASLGGAGGRALQDSLAGGHPRLEHLRLSRAPVRTLAELARGFPQLRYLRVYSSERLRTLGELRPVAGTLAGLELFLTGIKSLDGIEVLQDLEALVLYGGKVTDLRPLAALRSLRYAELESGPGIASLEPLREHPKLRMLALGPVQDGDLSPLASLPELVAVGRGARLVGEPPWPDLAKLPRDHPLRREFARAVYG